MTLLDTIKRHEKKSWLIFGFLAFCCLLYYLLLPPVAMKFIMILYYCGCPTSILNGIGQVYDITFAPFYALLVHTPGMDVFYDRYIELLGVPPELFYN